MTNDAIFKLNKDTWGETLAFARAIIAAHEAKLREGTEVPEAVGFMWQHDETGRIGYAEANQKPMWGKGNPRLHIIGDIFTHNQLQSYGDARALAARDAKSKACTWSQVDCFDMPGVYDTGCNNAWSFTEGDLSDNKIKYCPFCSGHIDAAMKRGEA